jgi:hypothetical protein
MRKRQYKEKRPVRLGAMAPARDRTVDAPTYVSILLKHGFIGSRETDGVTAFAMWQRVAEDKRVIAMSHEIERPRHRVLASVTAGYMHFGNVLSKMTSRQLNALKRRVGVLCEAK